MSEKSAKIIDEYIHQNRLLQRDAAELFGVTRLTIIKYLKGHNIHPLVRKRIEKATQGEIKASSLD